MDIKKKLFGAICVITSEPSSDDIRKVINQVFEDHKNDVPFDEFKYLKMVS